MFAKSAESAKEGSPGQTSEAKCRPGITKGRCSGAAPGVRENPGCDRGPARRLARAPAPEAIPGFRPSYRGCKITQMAAGGKKLSTASIASVPEPTTSRPELAPRPTPGP